MRRNRAVEIAPQAGHEELDHGEDEGAEGEGAIVWAADHEEGPEGGEWGQHDEEKGAWKLAEAAVVLVVEVAV